VKRISITAVFVLMMALLSGCSSGGLSASNKIVCAEVAEIMKGSGYMQGTRESLMKAVVELAEYFLSPTCSLGAASTGFIVIEGTFLAKAKELIARANK
jgi:hypothetical protein